MELVDKHTLMDLLDIDDEYTLRKYRNKGMPHVMDEQKYKCLYAVDDVNRWLVERAKKKAEQLIARTARRRKLQNDRRKRSKAEGETNAK